MKLLIQRIAVMSVPLGLIACGDSNSNMDTELEQESTTIEYQVSVQNLTADQPFSPLTLVIHSSSDSLWKLGESASDAIEEMAEGGDNSLLIETVAGLPAASGEGIIMPGAAETVTLTSDDDSLDQITLTTMLVNTNDAFAGINAEDISSLATSESMSWYLSTYDAGTEYNSESSGTIPGPADGGEGFSATRDDVMNKISRHPGLVTQADDAMSVLMPSHRIDTVVGMVTITRLN